jgi:monoterpene epsilon-lactone hydrolase
LSVASWQSRWLEWLLRLRRRRIDVDCDIGALRSEFEALDEKEFRPDPRARRTPVDADGVPCEWLEMPESRPERLLLYLHGGGFVVRTPNLHARYVARICRALGARALIVDYRLAPEHPFPAGIDDCHAAYRWTLAQGVAPGSIVIAGDSAGGNLTLVTLQKILAAGEPPPACAIALSPAVDLTMGSKSFIANERSDAIFTLSTVLALRGLYVAPRFLAMPEVSPLFGDLAGLPPLLLQAGGREMLRDDSIRFAEATRAAGGDVECEVWPGMQHVFPLLQFLPESARAIDSVVRFIHGRTGWAPATDEAGANQLCAA